MSTITQEPPAGLVENTAREQTRSNRNDSMQLVSFKLSDETYGIEITKIREIILVGQITRVPETPHYIKGLINLRSSVIPVIDLRARFGCSVVGIERQGLMIPLPPPESVLYPRDKVLLMGTMEQVHTGRDFLGAVSGAPETDSLFEEVRMDALSVPEWSGASGRSLGEISPARDHGVQIAGIRRGAERILNPGAQEVLRAADQLLVLGTPVQIREFRGWLAEKPAQDGQPP